MSFVWRHKNYVLCVLLSFLALPPIVLCILCSLLLCPVAHGRPGHVDACLECPCKHGKRAGRIVQLVKEMHTAQLLQNAVHSLEEVQDTSLVQGATDSKALMHRSYLPTSPEYSSVRVTSLIWTWSHNIISKELQQNLYYVVEHVQSGLGSLRGSAWVLQD
eukprot:608193-Amphidinium_carterae.1